MFKHAVITIGILLLVGVGMYGAYRIIRPDARSAAAKAESEGNYRAALDGYLTALVRHSERVEIPDVGGAMVGSPSEWQDEVAEALGKLESHSKADTTFMNILSAIGRCTTFVERQNMIRKIETEKLSREKYSEVWAETFFPENVPMHEEQQPLIEKAIKKDFSMVTLTPRRGGFSYEGHVVNLETGTSTPVKLYAGAGTSFPALGGPHALIIRAGASFPTGEVWESPESYISFTVPDSAVLMNIVLETRVERT